MNKLIFFSVVGFSLICYFLFVREDIKGRLPRHGRWKDMTTYHRALFLGTMLLPIALFGMVFALLFGLFFAKVS
jgi:hypothetical protein